MTSAEEYNSRRIVQDDKGERARLSRRIAIYSAVCFLVAFLSGWLWHTIASLPSYTASEDGSVVITERAQSQIFVVDALYVAIAVVAGLALGAVAWLLFCKDGWICAVIAAIFPTISGLLCWGIGVILGPRDFAQRVADAVPGDLITPNFTLHTWVPVCIWPLFAIIPIMLYANLSGDRERVAIRMNTVSSVESDQPGDNPDGKGSEE